MKMIRSAVMVAVAKKVYDEARKPENQQRIKEVVASVQSSVQNRAKGRR